LERARERLSFYESFDRTIGETLRRTGEMMEETVALREEAKRAAAEAAEARTSAEEALQRERHHYRGLVEDALSEIRTARPMIDAMIARLESALTDLSGEEDASDRIASEQSPEADPSEPVAQPTPAPEEPAPDTTVEGLDVESLAPAPDSEPEPHADENTIEAVSAPEEDEPETAEPDVEEADETPSGEAPEPELDNGPGIIDVIAHGVPSAATAIGLQKMLQELDTVSSVEAREFADGELRLQVNCTGPFPEQPLADWLSQNSGSLVSRNGASIELTFS